VDEHLGHNADDQPAVPLEAFKDVRRFDCEKRTTRTQDVVLLLRIIVGSSSGVAFIPSFLLSHSRIVVPSVTFCAAFGSFSHS
jgi:hypothetical protein